MWFFVGFLISLNFIAGLDYNVKLTHTEPAVFGENVSFTAITSVTNGSQPKESFVYLWRDDANHNESLYSDAQCNWTVIYLRDNSGKTSFNVEVEVSRMSRKDFPVGSATISFDVKNATTTTTTPSSSPVITTTSSPKTTPSSPHTTPSQSTTSSTQTTQSSPNTTPSQSTTSSTQTTQRSTTKRPNNNAITTAFSWWLFIPLLFLVL